MIDETGERTDTTLRMIERPVAVVAPRDRPARARLDAVPHLPPVIPELSEIGPAILGGEPSALAMIEKPGCPEKPGFACGFVHRQQHLHGTTLREDGHRCLILPESERLGEGLEHGLLVRGRVNHDPQPIALAPQTVLGGGDEKRIHFPVTHATERRDTSAGKGLGKKVGTSLEPRELRQQQLRNVAMIGRAGEETIQRRLIGENVEDDLVEIGIGEMAMPFPVPHVDVDLEGTSPQLAVDAQRDLGEVGTRPSIPMPELHDLDSLAPGPGKDPPELTAEPLRLQVDLVAERTITPPYHEPRKGPDSFTKGFVSPCGDRKGRRHELTLTKSVQITSCFSQPATRSFFPSIRKTKRETATRTIHQANSGMPVASVIRVLPTAPTGRMALFTHPKLTA